MKTILLLAVFSWVSFGLSFPAEAASSLQLSDDFYVTVSDAVPAFVQGRFAVPRPLDDRASCEQSLSRVVCDTTATDQEMTTQEKSVPCAANSAQFVPALMQIYDEMPERMRISLCTLDRVFISDAITSTAFASAVTDPSGIITGGFIGLRKSTLVSQPTGAQLFSWKEQLAFGGSKSFLSNDPGLVQIDFGLKMSTLKTDGLFYVLMHELAHLIDFNNNINSPSEMDTDWSRLSWQNARTPLTSATFFKRNDFCFYNCSKYLSPDDAKQIYESLAQSAFVTTYASTNPYEDFAENWAWHMMEQSKDPDYKITVPGEGTIDMNPIFKSNPKIQRKIEFIDQLWNREDLQISNRLVN